MGADTDSLLRVIDGLLPEREQFAAKRGSSIDSLMRELPKATSDEERYNLYRSIFGAYRAFRNDSALAVADRRLATARRMADESKVISASLNLADGFSACGNYYEALTVLDTLPRAKMQPHHKRYLYDLYVRTYRKMAKADMLESNKLAFGSLVKNYRDSSITIFPDDGAALQYIKVWRLMDSGHWLDALKLMEATERKFGPIDSMAGYLGQKALIYHNLGKKELEKEYLAKAAIVDIKSGIKDHTSLMALAELLNGEGDTDRAYEYIRCALEDAYFSNSKARTSEILEAIPIIDAAHSQAERRRTNIVWILFALLGIMAVGLAAALWIVKSHLSKVRRIKRELSEANSVKTEYINELFNAHSSYIERTSDFRKRMGQLLKGGKYQDAKLLIESGKIESDELRELYSRFDAIFLSLHPHFIEEYNSFVKPEARVEPNATTLTSALRVLALMKVGVTSVSNIASMLHYTTQTVYNYRNKIKASLEGDTSRFYEWIGVQDDSSTRGNI